MSASSSSLPPTPVTLETLPFDNRALRELPVDPVEENYVREVRGACFSRVRPTPVSNPSLVVHSPSALALLGLTAPEAEARRPDFPALFAGNNPLPGAEPAAHCYCGHQFGSFAGQLGDGATMYLGEIRSPPASWPPSPLPSAWPVPPAAAGRVELQFKGAGKTPYSRSADGRKVLRSSIREFLCSEANAALGIPTTRAATVVTSDTRVVRDIFYVGNPIAERATVITRIAPTFLRFGSFEIFKGADGSTGRAGPSAGRADLLRLLVDFTGRNYYPELWTDAAVSPPSSSPANPPTGPVSPAEAARALSLFREVSLRTARLFAAWQCFGFCHGVLNTDNMSVVGVTIDYGPFGWMERFDPEFICNASDDGGRYTYENQPRIGQWNLMRLAEALEPALGGLDWKPALRAYPVEFRRAYNDGFRRKLGLGFSRADPAAVAPADADGGNAVDAADEPLVQDLLDLMNGTGADFTATFRALHAVDIPAAQDDGHQDASMASSSPQRGADAALDLLVGACATASELAAAKKPQVPLERLQGLLALAKGGHPMLAPQEEAIEEEIARHEAHAKLAARTDAAKEDEDRASWAEWLSRYRARLADEARPHLLAAAAAAAGNAGGGGGEAAKAAHARLSGARLSLMARANPKHILRNWIAQVAIAAAERGDFSVVRKVYERLADPFGLNDAPGAEDTFSADMAALHAQDPSSTPVTGGAGTTAAGASGTPPLKGGSCKAPSWASNLKVT